MMIAAHQTMLAPPALPYAKEVQYLVFDGTQCVEAVVPTDAHTLTVHYNGTYVSDGEANPLGLYDNYPTTANRVYAGPYGARARCVLIQPEYNISQNVTNADVVQTVDVFNRQHTVVKNGTTYTATIGNFGTLTTQKPVGVGARNVYRNTGSHEIAVGISGKIYSFKSWISGVAESDWIPVVDLNGVACFYDQIGGSLHYTWTGNPLVAGPDKT